jgi:hypothetical protein
MALYKATVYFQGTADFEIEAADRDEAGYKATEIFEDADKGRLALADFNVTSTFVETMTPYEIKELKCDI